MIELVAQCGVSYRGKADKLPLLINENRFVVTACLRLAVFWQEQFCLFGHGTIFS